MRNARRNVDHRCGCPRCRHTLRHGGGRGAGPGASRRLCCRCWSSDVWSNGCWRASTGRWHDRDAGRAFPGQCRGRRSLYGRAAFSARGGSAFCRRSARPLRCCRPARGPPGHRAHCGGRTFVRWRDRCRGRGAGSTDHSGGEYRRHALRRSPTARCSGRSCCWRAIIRRPAIPRSISSAVAASFSTCGPAASATRSPRRITSASPMRRCSSPHPHGRWSPSSSEVRADRWTPSVRPATAWPHSCRVRWADRPPMCRPPRRTTRTSTAGRRPSGVVSGSASGFEVTRLPRLRRRGSMHRSRRRCRRLRRPWRVRPPHRPRSPRLTRRHHR